MVRPACRIFFLLILFATWLSAAYPVSANGITVSPVFQEVTLDETTGTARSSIELTNSSQQTITLEVFPTEVNQVDELGNIALEQFSGAASESLPYVSFSQDRISLEPESSQTIEVLLSDRASLQPGGSYVGVVFRLQQESESTDQVIQPAVVSYLLITKTGGEQFALRLQSVQGLPVLVSFGLPKSLALIFSNEGNIHVQPRGTVSFTDSFGRLIGQGTVNESSQYVLPGRQRRLFQPISPGEALLPVSFVSTEITGSVGEERSPFSYESSFIIISPYVVISAGVLIVFLSVITVLRRRRK